jgi:tRNA (cytidine/uridine-2'-O-)-methyltransferase
MADPILNVVLFQPEIPPNTGTIGRLCLAAGCRLHLIKPLGFSLEQKALKRAGLDYWDDVDLRQWDDWEAFLAGAVSDESRVWLLSTKGSRAYWDESFQRGDFLVFGPETRGLPETMLNENADQVLTIPQRAGRSLNLACAASIVVYEGARQLEG